MLGKSDNNNGKDKFGKGDNNERRSDSSPPTAFLHAACHCPFVRLFLTLSLSFLCRPNRSAIMGKDHDDDNAITWQGRHCKNGTEAKIRQLQRRHRANVGKEDLVGEVIHLIVTMTTMNMHTETSMQTMI